MKNWLCDQLMHYICKWNYETNKLTMYKATNIHPTYPKYLWPPCVGLGSASLALRKAWLSAGTWPQSGTQKWQCASIYTVYLSICLSCPVLSCPVLFCLSLSPSQQVPVVCTVSIFTYPHTRTYYLTILLSYYLTILLSIYLSIYLYICRFTRIHTRTYIYTGDFNGHVCLKVIQLGAKRPSAWLLASHRPSTWAKPMVM